MLRGQLLFELQQPSDGRRGYFYIRGFHVAVRDSASGNLEAVVAVSALLNEKDAAKMELEWKTTDKAHRTARPDADGERY